MSAFAMLGATPAVASHKGCGALGLFDCPHSAESPPPNSAPDPGGDENTAIPSPPLGGKLMGFNSDLSVSGGISPQLEFGLAQNAGANTHRLNVLWLRAEPNPPTAAGRSYSEEYLSGIDARYEELLSRGMKPILVLHSAPRWAQARDGFGVPECLDCSILVEPDESNASDWAAFAKLAAQRWPEAAAYEIWNEPNQFSSYRPRPNTGNYLRLYVLAYDAIKAVNPDAAVLTGGISDVWASDGYNIQTREFIEGLLTYGLRAEAPDYRLSVHMYPAGEELGAGSNWAVRWHPVVDALRDHGDGNREIWMTETGISVTPSAFQGKDYPPFGLVATPEQQRDILRRQYNRLLSMDSVGPTEQRLNVKAVIFHTLKDDTHYGSEELAHGYGFLRHNPWLDPRPVYCYFVQNEPPGASQRSHPGC